MTENEAIKAIQNDLECHSKELKPAYKEVLKMAIQALEEIQQYRAIGTVEGYELAINESIDKHNLMIVYKDRLKEFEAIGTIEEFKVLKEKSVAKKPIDKIMYLECPACGDVGILDCGYCSVCGQKLDWQ